MLNQLEQTLISKAQAGNKAAFNLLMLHYEQPIARIVKRYMPNTCEVDDIVQEVFIKAYQSITSFRGDSAFYTWLYRIAINTARNYLANIRKTPPLEAENLDLLPELERLTDQDNPELLLISEEVAKIIITALTELPAELQTALILREVNGLNYAEIADKMNCPVGTVRSRIARARAAIIARLQQQ